MGREEGQLVREQKGCDKLFQRCVVAVFKFSELVQCGLKRRCARERRSVSRWGCTEMQRVLEGDGEGDGVYSG